VSSPGSDPERALILAPRGRDATVAAEILSGSKITTAICPDPSDLVHQIGRGAGFALVTDEALRNADLRELSRWRVQQPSWSDFPFIVLTLRGGGSERNPALDRLTEVLGNVNFLERPFHPATLTSVARTALRARWRQYEARDRLEELRLLIEELNHRVKNTLATVQSITAQTLRTADSKEAARDAVETRLLALSRAHDVLTRERWGGANLTEVVERALEPYQVPGENRFRIVGSHLRVTPRMSLALAMALHELATNAVKYGALSNKAGSVEVSWKVANGTTPPRLSLRWAEAGGPAVTKPQRRGFGSRLIERSLAHDLDGHVAITFAPTGVVCTVDAPVS